MTTESTNAIPTKFVSRKSASKISKHLLAHESNSSNHHAEYLEAIEKAQRWRTQHALPTENCFMTLLGMTQAYPDVILTFRLKRMKSILAKIRRPGKHYQLGTMDDIGGCRLILENMEQVHSVIDTLGQSLTLKRGMGCIKNYIDDKPSV